MLTLVLSSLISRSWRLRDVQCIPSRPTKGDVLTPNVIRTVGSLMSMVGRATGLSEDAMVSPIDTPSRPVTATMSPAWASDTSTRSMPWNTKMRFQSMGGVLGVAAQQCHVLSQPECAIGDSAHGHLSQIVIIVKRRYQHLQRGDWVSGWRRNRIQDRFKEGLHIRTRRVQAIGGITLPGRCIQHREI